MQTNRTNCFCCNSKKLKAIIDLNDQPWCGNFLRKDEIGKEEFYPLKLMECEDCSLFQLNYFVPKEKMFSNHSYVSGTTKTLTEHFYNIAKENIQQFNLKNDDLIVDIGGNDGTQLLQYKKLGCENILNIESATNICEIAIKNNVPTICNFFNDDTVYENELQNKAKLINASGILFHLEELHSVLRGIKNMLHKDGVFIVQFMYAIDMLKNGNFDTIYHEHLVYYTIKSINTLLEKYKLKIVDGYHSDIHSGSMIIKCVHSDISYPISSRFIDCIIYETSIYNRKLINKFINQTSLFKKSLKQKINEIVESGKTIYGLGAPAKGNTLLNFLELDSTKIKKIYEVNPMRISLYTPGSHIQIEKENLMDIPDYFLILSHNFSNEIINTFKENNIKVNFIIPFTENGFDIVDL